MKVLIRSIAKGYALNTYLKDASLLVACFFIFFVLSLVVEDYTLDDVLYTSFRGFKLKTTPQPKLIILCAQHYQHCFEKQ